MGCVSRSAGRRLRRLLSSLPALGALVVLAACGSVARGEAGEDLARRPIRVVTTTGMITDLVTNVGGERVDVTGLMGPGVDPHLYKASERDVILLAEADAIFYNGLHLEAKMSDVFEKIRGRIVTVAVTEHIDRSRLLAPPEFEGAYDPHLWFDVSLWMKAAERVRDALADLDPGRARLYRRNAEVYLDKLDGLHSYVAAQARRVPERKRVLITAHDAFNYFARAYDFEVKALQGISTATEAGTGDVRALADFIVQRRIPAVFVETSVPTKLLEAVQQAVRARGFDVSIGAPLFSDAMGDPGTPEGTYVGMVRHNIDAIVSGLLEGEGT